MKKLILKNMEVAHTPKKITCFHCGASKTNGYDIKVTLNFTSSGNFENFSTEEISYKIYNLVNEIKLSE